MDDKYLKMFFNDLQEYGFENGEDTPDMHANIIKMKEYLSKVEKQLINGSYIGAYMDLVYLSGIAYCMYERINIMREAIKEDSDPWCYERCWSCSKPISGDLIGTPFVRPLYCEECNQKTR